MMRSRHLVFLVALIAAGSTSLYGAASGSVSGVVRDSSGVPQIGAVVQLLRPDLSVITAVYTDSAGRFTIPAILPGRYALKAMDMSFLPSLREDVHVRRNTVVNLTLSTLYEVMQWLPAQPRAANARKDDWAWTLRSEANRPLLRWLEDGPLVVVSDGSGAPPKLKARLMATGEAGTFGESGQRITASIENTPSSSRELLARVDFAPNTDAAMESMLGFSQDLGFAGSVQSVAAVSVHPDVEDGSGGENLDEAAFRSWESMNLGDEFDAEAGSEQVVARFAQNSPNTIVASMPFASVGWHDGNSVVRYRMTTFVSSPAGADETDAATWLPALSEHNGRLALEHGLHQEIGWSRQTDSSRMSVVVYSDNLQDPVMEAAAHFAEAASTQMANQFLYDGASGLLRASGPNFSSAGLTASVERQISTGNSIRVAYANGDALVMPALPHAVPLSQVLGVTHPRRAQTYTLALSGTIDGTRTQWHASYRWQPSDAVTGVAPFAAGSEDPYLSLRIRQPICLRRDGSGGIEALLDVRNLLAEGYRPYLLSDGSLLIFAQNQRGIRGGLAFTF
ncbi:MAG TPA: carboxypeptidase-like regulatory domain-containing protein [Terracidiphilus sp.]|nr:carboxypeptidase-like regulatory domain-containing protein [Terracidiphilus sp.]